MWEDEVTSRGHCGTPQEVTWPELRGGMGRWWWERWSCHHCQKLAAESQLSLSDSKARLLLYLTIWSFIQQLVTNLPCAQACARCWGYSCEQNAFSWNLQPRRKTNKNANETPAGPMANAGDTVQLSGPGRAP